MNTKIVIGAILIFGYIAFLLPKIATRKNDLPSPAEASSHTGRDAIAIPAASSEPTAETSMFNLGGEWRGQLQPLHGEHLDPRDWNLGLRFFIRGKQAQVFIDRGGQWQEVKAGQFQVTQHKSIAVIHSIDSGTGWVESWVFSVSRRDEDSIFVYGNRIINNYGKAAADDNARITYGASGVFTRSYERFKATSSAPSVLTEEDIASQFKEAMERARRVSGLKNHGDFTFYNFKILNESADSLTLGLHYHYDGLDEDKVWVGATTYSNGVNTGNWSYRPSKLRRGSNQAIIQVGMKSDAPKEYCSDSIEINVYVGGKGTFFKQQVPYKKCWENPVLHE